MIKTVLGNIKENDLGITLSHEHICCYSEYLYSMAGKSYLDKAKLLEVAVRILSFMKEKYNLSSFIDCTPVNIGRDIELLKEVSKRTGVNIICSTGFYYTEEPLLKNLSEKQISEYIISDAEKVNAGIIKCAVENENISSFDEKILRATAKAQLSLKLPIVLHTNANNKNALKALEILLAKGVKPEAITGGHLSDTEDYKYIRLIAKMGCYIGFDRMYGNYSAEYINKKVNAINELCNKGFEDKILLSHDELVYNGFNPDLIINEIPRFPFVFDNILPNLHSWAAEQIMVKNPIKMLKCGE